MRALIWIVLAACGSHAADPPKAVARLQIVYALDLDRAVDDKASDVRTDLEAALADRKIAASVRMVATTTGALVVAPDDAAQEPAIEELVKASYGDTVERRACNTSAPPSAVCLRISAAYVDALKKEALQHAVTTVRERLDAANVANPSVVERGGQIVVEFPEADPHGAQLRSLISRAGQLEMKVVDDGSSYMRRLFSHVGSTRAGEATDAQAIADGITVAVDSWRPEEGSQAHHDYYMVARDHDGASGRDVIARYVAALASADPAFRIPDDRQIAYEHVVPDPGAKDPRPYWRTYFLERAARLTGTAISNAMGTYDAYSNRPIVILEFNRFGTRVFGDLTAEIAGKKLATLLDGNITSAPIVNGAIRGGRATITLGGSDIAKQEADRDALVNVLKSGSLPSPLVEVSSTVVR